MVRVEQKNIGKAAVTHNRLLRAARRLPDQLTVLFELRQDRCIHSHFLSCTFI